jgi:predicted Rossmann fold flavoprotein
MNTQHPTVIIIGGGASGMFCAVNLARQAPHLKVIVLEKTDKLLSKVRISGGGRCNVTHACYDIPTLSSRYPRGQQLMKKTLHWFQPKDTIQWFQERGVTIVAEADGRMFPSTNSSATIIECLMQEANKYRVQFLMHRTVQAITPSQDAYLVTTNNEQWHVQAVVVACGGFPKLSQFEWLQNLQLPIAAPVPSLFTLNTPTHPITALMGVSVADAIVKIAGTKLQQQGPVLITHWGLSGPAVLKLSAYGALHLASVQYQYQAIINWLPSYNNETLKQYWMQLRQQLAAQVIAHKNPFDLPKRLWEFLLTEAGIQGHLRYADITASMQQKLIQKLVQYELPVHGKTTYKDEFVTAGGVELQSIDANTMECKQYPKLYFTGEILNVDGITGGYNFQHAWASGWLAAKHIAATL